MQLKVDIPRAFSVRDENELYAFQHLMSRMNPKLEVSLVTTGVHVHGGCTVFWAIVHATDQHLGKAEVEEALREAGYDFKHNGPLKKLDTATVGGLSD